MADFFKQLLRQLNDIWTRLSTGQKIISSSVVVLTLGGIIALIVWGVQTATRKDAGQAQPPPHADSSPTALDIAKRRYARGDISREEFEQIKKDLSGS